MKVFLWRIFPLFPLLLGGCETPVDHRAADRRQEEVRIGFYDQAPSMVSKVQLILMYEGFGPAYTDGFLGPETRDTVKEFQTSRGLAPTGFLGDATWVELMKAERKEGPFSVERLQRGLRNAGFSPGSIDGQAGERTFTALTRFQKAKGLTVTPRPNPETWAALKSSMPR